MSPWPYQLVRHKEVTTCGASWAYSRKNPHNRWYSRVDWPPVDTPTEESAGRQEQGCFVTDCDLTYWRTMTYDGRRVPCCCKHAKRIYRRGTHEPFEPALKLKPSDRTRIIELWRAGWTARDLAHKYSVSSSLVGSVTRGLPRHEWMRQLPRRRPPKR